MLRISQEQMQRAKSAHEALVKNKCTVVGRTSEKATVKQKQALYAAAAVLNDEFRHLPAENRVKAACDTYNAGQQQVSKLVQELKKIHGGSGDWH